MTYNAANNKASRSNIEQWKTIDGFPDYMVSDQGRILSTKHDNHRVLKQCLRSSGYLKVGLCKTENGEVTAKTMDVHRLVASAFIDNPEQKSEINHKNGIKTDNRVENLEWCSRLENMTHAALNGLTASGENHWKAKLTEADVLEIIEILSWNEFTQQEIADEYGVSSHAISDIKNGKRWSSVTGINSTQKIKYIERTERIYFANDDAVTEAI